MSGFVALWVFGEHDPLSLERGEIGGRSWQSLGIGNGLKLRVAFLELNPLDHSSATSHCIVRTVAEIDSLNFSNLFVR